jgi:hypothetical protein
MFIQVMKEQKNEKKREANQSVGSSGLSGGTGSGPAPNPNYEPGGGGKGMDETTVYHNTSYGPGENPNEGVDEEIREKFQN